MPKKDASLSTTSSAAPSASSASDLSSDTISSSALPGAALSSSVPASGAPVVPRGYADRADSSGDRVGEILAAGSNPATGPRPTVPPGASLGSVASLAATGDDPLSAELVSGSTPVDKTSAGSSSLSIGKSAGSLGLLKAGIFLPGQQPVLAPTGGKGSGAPRFTRVAPPPASSAPRLADQGADRSRPTGAPGIPHLGTGPALPSKGASFDTRGSAARPPPGPPPPSQEAAWREQWEAWFAELPPATLLSLADRVAPEAKGGSVRALCSLLAAPSLRSRAYEEWLSSQGAPGALTTTTSAFAPRMDREQEALVDRLVADLSGQDLVDAAAAFEVSVRATDTPRAVARAIVEAGFGHDALEQAVSKEDGGSVVSSRAGPEGPQGPEEPPAVSVTARVGLPRPGDVPPSPTPPSPRDTAPSPDTNALLARLAALERLIQRGSSAPLLAGARRAALLAPAMLQPSPARMEQLTHLAKGASGASADLALTVPSFGPQVEAILAHNAQARYTATELSWAAQRQADLLALLYSLWCAVAEFEQGLSPEVATQFDSVVRRMEDVWAMANGHAHAVTDRMKQLARGLVTRQYEEMAPIPRNAGVLPPHLVSIEELNKWKKAASFQVSVPAKRAPEPAGRPSKFHKPAPKAPKP